MTVAVLVEIAPADQQSSEVQVLLESCNLEMRRRGSCELALEGSGGDAVPVAIVSWEGGAHLVARIQVGLPGAKEAWLARTVSFTTADLEVERWRTVGFAIATLVGEAVPASDEPASAAATSDGNRGGSDRGIDRSGLVGSDDARKTAEEGRDGFGIRPGFWVDAEAVLASGTAATNPARGGGLRLSAVVDRSSWFGTGSARYTVQPLDGDRFSVAKFETFAGVGYAATLSDRLGVEWTGEALLELIRASGVDAGTGASGHAARWLPGVRLEAGIHWMASPRVGILVAAAVSGVASPTEVRVHGTLRGRLPVLEPGLALGARLALP